MLSGYLQTETYVRQEIDALPLHEGDRHPWSFLPLRERLNDPDLQDEIEIGSSLFFRPLRRWWRRRRRTRARA